MNKPNIRLTAFLIGIALAAVCFSQTGPAQAKLTILPTRVNVRAVLDGVVLAPGAAAVYAPGNPAVLMVDLGPVRPPADELLIPADEPALVEAARFVADAGGRFSLALTLKEKVPFRIFTEGTKTVIELIKIQRGEEYFVAPATQAELDRSIRTPRPLVLGAPESRGDRLDFASRLEGKAIVNIFALDAPLRLVVDVFDAVMERATLNAPVGSHGVARIKAGQFQEGDPDTITRLVFELQEPRMFTLASGNGSFDISFPDAAAVIPTAPAAFVVKSAPKVEPPPAAEEKVEAVQPVAKSGGNGDSSPVKAETKVETAASSPADKKIEVKIKQEEEKPPAVVVPPPDNPIQEEYGDLPPAQEDQFGSRTIHDPAAKYSGELISPRFKDADLRDVVLWLGEKVSLNVTFDPEVRGRVTGSFQDVPWDQYLDIILKNNKLGRVLEGNVLRIAPLTVLAEEERAQQTLRAAMEASGPIMTKTYALSYATARDVMDIIKNKKSERGEIVIDTRTNTLIVSDVQEKIDLIDQIVTTLDAATPQVTIETRIVEATSTFVRNLGIQWGTRAAADPFYGNQTSLQFPNKISVDGALIPEGTVTKGVSGPLGGYAVNLPAASFSTAVGISLANVLDTFRVDMALTALETEGSGKIVSSQRVTAQNNKEAYINQGRQIPVQTTANFTVTTQYVNAGLELRATPQITAEGTIIMTLDIQNNAADFGNLVNGIPPITTQSAKTTVCVPDGGTTVIGGVYRVEDSVTQERVPFLHQIPILGTLFKNLAKNRTNRELLIFITPRIQK